MNPGVLLVTVAGLLIGAGTLTVGAAVRGVPVLPPGTARSGRRRPRWTSRHAAAAGAGVVVLLLSGWPVAGAAAAAAVLFVPRVLGGGRAAQSVIGRSEALADWARRLADLISSGAAGSARDALARSAGSAPAPIAAEVARLVARIGPQGTEPALRLFAREVGDPAADKIAGVLILRERNGGPGLADVLTGLAQDLQDRSRMVREVEAERAKPRANMRTIVGVTGALIALMMLFARTFLSGYSTPAGQLALAGVAGVFTVALRWMRRLSDPPVPFRVLSDPAPQAGSGS